MDLDKIIHNEITHSHEVLIIGKFIETESKTVVTNTGRSSLLLFNGYRVFVGDD